MKTFQILLESKISIKTKVEWKNFKERNRSVKKSSSISYYTLTMIKHWNSKPCTSEDVCTKQNQKGRVHQSTRLPSAYSAENTTAPVERSFIVKCPVLVELTKKVPFII